MMTVSSTLYQRLKNALPNGAKLRIRSLIELALKVGKKEFYGQFGEDAVLQACFEQREWQRGSRPSHLFSAVKLPPGFYVDIGAYSPKALSNTYWFYKRGWRGICVDATPGSMDSFRLVRKHDINVEAAISDVTGDMVFYCWDSPCVMNTLSKEKASGIAECTGIEPSRTQVTTCTLEALLDTYLAPGQHIDFMSIDVEGHGLEVLRSGNWEKYRPELVVIEEHARDLNEILHSLCYEFLIQQGYSLYSWVQPSLFFKCEDQV